MFPTTKNGLHKIVKSGFLNYIKWKQGNEQAEIFILSGVIVFFQVFEFSFSVIF